MELVDLFRRFSRVPGGKQVFTRGVTLRVPYFSTIRPTITSLAKNRVEVRMKKRRAVLNHIGTVHAIAACNLCELCAGLLIEVSLDAARRWIPKGMTVAYLKKCETDLVALGEITSPLVTGDNILKISVRDTRQVEVVRADINMYVSVRKEGAGR